MNLGKLASLLLKFFCTVIIENNNILRSTNNIIFREIQIIFFNTRNHERKNNTNLKRVYSYCHCLLLLLSLSLFVYFFVIFACAVRG